MGPVILPPRHLLVMVVVVGIACGIGVLLT
jgi:hypothetical protein